MSEQDRLPKLEVLVTEQELLLEQYSDLIRDQQKQIDGLSKRLELLELKLSRYQETGSFDTADDVPPHY